MAPSYHSFKNSSTFNSALTSYNHPSTTDLFKIKAHPEMYWEWKTKTMASPNDQKTCSDWKLWATLLGRLAVVFCCSSLADLCFVILCVPKNANFELMSVIWTNVDFLLSQTWNLASIRHFCTQNWRSLENWCCSN